MLYLNVGRRTAYVLIVLALLGIFLAMMNTGTIYWLLCILTIIVTYSSAYFYLLYSKRKGSETAAKLESYPSVSIIIPAYNSASTLAGCLDSVKAFDYPNVAEIIVVDDASTDNTDEILKRYPDVKAIRRTDNKGKATALNLALSQARGELVLCVDSDTYPEMHSLKPLAGKVMQPGVAAATPRVRAANPSNLLEHFQDIEYVLWFGFFQYSLHFIDGLMVTPGPMSIFRKDILAKAGGFDGTTITEDMEVALRLKDLGYKISFTADAVCYTVVPKTVSHWLRQRIRWYRGKIVNGVKYRHLLLNAKNEDFGMFVFPVSFLLEIATVLAFIVQFYLYAHRAALFAIGLGYAWLNSVAIPLDVSLVINAPLIFFLMSIAFWCFIYFESLKIAKEKLTPGKLAMFGVSLVPYAVLVGYAYTVSYLKEINGSSYRW